MDKRSMMGDKGWAGDHRSMVDGMGSAVEDRASCGSNLSQSLAVVQLMDSSMASTEGLGHLDGPHFSISLGYRLMAGLPGSSSVDLRGG